MNDSLVTISIPTYNSETFIGLCLEAIRNQTYKNVEINIVDGNSKDKTLEIARNYGVEIKICDAALLAARNEGVKMAKGEFVLLLDSDQILESTAVERAVKKIQEEKLDMLVLEEDVYKNNNFVEYLFHADRKLVHAVKDFNPMTSVMLPRFYKVDLLKRAFSNISEEIMRSVGGQDHAIIYLEAWNISQKIDLLSDAVKHIEPDSLKVMWKKFYRWGYTSVGARVNKYTELLNKKERFRKGLFQKGLIKESFASVLLLLLKGIPYKLGMISGKRAQKNTISVEEIVRRTHPYYKFVKKNLDLKEGDVFLDLGCGTADFSSEVLKEFETKNVIGLDFSKENLKFIKNKGLKMNLVLGSALNLPFKKGTIDACTCLEMIEHLGSRKNMMQMLKEVYFSLDAEKQFIITTPSKGKFMKYCWLDPVYLLGRHHHFTDKELCNLFSQAGFEVKKLNTIGGPLFPTFFYTIFWWVKKTGLLKVNFIRNFFIFIIEKMELEFKTENTDGCMFVLKTGAIGTNVSNRLFTELFEILACPICKKDLVQKGKFLVCENCNRAYPILDGNVPNMKTEESWFMEEAEKCNFKHSFEL